MLSRYAVDVLIVVQIVEPVAVIVACVVNAWQHVVVGYVVVVGCSVGVPIVEGYALVVDEEVMWCVASSVAVAVAQQMTDDALCDGSLTGGS